MRKMWSVGVHGRSSALREQQRVLFSIGGEADRSMQHELLMEMTTRGNCRAMMVSNLDNRRDLLAVHAALQQACADNKLLSKTHFCVVAATPTDCALEGLAARVEKALETLQLQQLDLLLLRAQSLTGSNSIYERKRVVLEAWEHMMAIQQAGLVQHIGVSDLSVQDVDFMRTAYPANLPAAWSIEVQFPGMASKTLGLDVPLEEVTAFAHAHGIDVLARFPFNCLDTLEPQDLRDGWDLLTQTLAARYRERPFKFLVAHEDEGTTASYHMDSHAVSEATVMQNPLQVAVRYLIQKGLAVIPQGCYDLKNDTQDTNVEEALREIFGPLAHPFSGIHPSCSPHNMYSSLLSRDDLDAIGRTLPLATSFPQPSPPRTPISTTGRSRPGSRHDRQRNLPSAFSRPSTAE